MDHFRALKRTEDGLEIEGLDATSPATDATMPASPAVSATPLAEGTVLQIRRASTTGAEELACVVRGEDGQGWAVVTDGGETLTVESVTAMVVAGQEDGALQ